MEVLSVLGALGIPTEATAESKLNTGLLVAIKVAIVSALVGQRCEPRAAACGKQSKDV